MKNSARYIIFSLFSLFGSAHAGIVAVIVQSEFHNDSWYPLPAEQMESAAVDTALTQLSATGRFAFLYKPEAKLSTMAGSLVLEVSLVEPAESAKITIRLSLPAQQGSYVSSSSVSLRQKDHQGIFNALQQIGNEAAAQLVDSLEALSSKQNLSASESEIRDQIIAFNLKLISLNKAIDTDQLTEHNNSVLQQLDKLDTLISKVDAHDAYVKRSDIDKNRKLDAIYSEIQKLNVGTNTDNTAPEGGQLTAYDISQLPKIDKASQLKFDKKFADAKVLLTTLVNDKKISDVFRTAVDEELRINLPVYEAEITSNDISGNFMLYVQNDEYKKKLHYVSKLYDNVLAQKDLAFKKRLEISQKKDQLNLTADSMNTAVTAMRASSIAMLRAELRNIMAKHNMYRSMGMKGTGTDTCPDRDAIDAALKRSKINDRVLAYNTRENNCELLLEESASELLVYVFNEEGITYEHKKR